MLTEELNFVETPGGGNGTNYEDFDYYEDVYYYYDGDYDGNYDGSYAEDYDALEPVGNQKPLNGRH